MEFAMKIMRFNCSSFLRFFVCLVVLFLCVVWFLEFRSSSLRPLSWCYVMLPNLGSYVCVVIFQFFSYLFLGFYWVFVYIPYVLFGGGFTCAPIFEIFLSIFNLGLNLFLFSFFIVGRLCLSIMDYFLDLLRIFGAFGFISFSPYQVSEGKRVGLQFSSLFFFRPFVSHSLTETGFFLGFPEALEVLSFQIIYTIFQIVWSVLFFCVYVVGFFLDFGFMVLMLLAFLNLELLWDVWNWSVALFESNPVMRVGLGAILIVIFLFFCFFHRVMNFLNFQVIFFFIRPNNWFGLNLSPGFSVVKVWASSFTARIAFVRSGFTRLESLIIFTSHLRFDPKTVDLPLW